MSIEFWKKFDGAYPGDDHIIGELLHNSDLMGILKNDKEPYEQSCMLLASYFRDAINYGYLKAKCEKEQSDQLRRTFVA